MSIPTDFRDFLDKQGVRFEHHMHPTAYTAHETATSVHVPDSEMAKSVVINADGALLLAVLPADRRVDLDHLKFITRSANIRLAKEEEFTEVFHTCEPGAMPPFGNLFGVPTYCDCRLEMNDSIEFNAGSHTDTVRMAFHDFKRLAHPTVIDVVQHPRAL